MKIYHISTVHKRYDIRIFKKECITLVHAGFDVSFVVADGKGDELNAGVKIIDAGFPGAGRKNRFLKGTKLVQKIIQRDQPDVLHFHDPELLFLARKMAKKHIVIYDAHEDLPKQIISKPYIKPFLRKITASLAGYVEKRAAKKIYGAISVVNSIVNKYKSYNANTILLQNLPVLKSFAEPDFNAKDGSMVYAGGVTQIRGAIEMAATAKKLQMPISLYGPIESIDLEKQLKLTGGDFVNYCGEVNQEELLSFYHKASIGIILFHPEPNHINSSPNKLFEYMACGMAVVASDFPIWKEVINTYKCGICVNPLEIDEVANAILYLKNNPEVAIEMGKNGRKAVLEHFNWEIESRKLIDFYQKIEQ